MDIKSAKKENLTVFKELEGKQILKTIQGGDRLFLLDEKGRDYSSVGFAQFLQKNFNQGGRRMVFAIGGAHGFSDEVYERAEGNIRLSSMTFTHEMVRMIFLEQLYRSMTILKGEPYHHV
jgi:23S rRNA (pseudouridine1915-N3)-methyltransferase